MSDDEALRQQKEKFDEHRDWMKKQQHALDNTGSATAALARRIESEEGGVIYQRQQQQQQQHGHHHQRQSQSQSQSGGSTPRNRTLKNINRGENQAEEFDPSNMSAYMRRNLRKHSTSPLSAGRGGRSFKEAGGSPHQHQQHSPTSPNQQYSPHQHHHQQQQRSSPGGEKPAWINTKPGSTNARTMELSPEQYNKFNPPPPPSDDGGYDNDPLNVYSRSQLWQRRKQQKMFEARELKEHVEDAECTFSPVTHSKEYYSQSREQSVEQGYSSSQHPHYSTATSGGGHDTQNNSNSIPRSDFGGFRVSGWEEYLSRQQQARGEQAFKESRLKTNEKFKWKNETTVPDPFDLGRRRNHHIKALKMPFSAAPGAMAQATRQAPNAPSSNDVFAPLANVLPRGVFSGVTAAEIVDSAVLRSGGSSIARR